jgi:hypothetical protein
MWEMSPVMQNMKMGPDVLGTAKSESRRPKKLKRDLIPAVLENSTRHTRYRQKRLQERKT